MAVVEHKVPAPCPSTDHEPPRKRRTPEERRVDVCPICFLALPATTTRCFYCD